MKKKQTFIEKVGLVCLYAFALVWNSPKTLKRKLKKQNIHLTISAKKTMACALAIVMMITALPLSHVVANAAGNTLVQDIVLNEETNTYEIYTAQGLVEFRDKVNAGETEINGKIMNDIDLYSVCEGANSTDWNPIGNENNKYNGIFDGNNKEISNIYFYSSNETFIALFGYTGTNALIKNLNASGEFYNYDFIAGIVGQNNGMIDNCSFSGRVTGYFGHAAGICFTNNGTIKNCINYATVKLGLTVSVEGRTEIFGGIVGINAGTVSECINKGTFEATNASKVGGIVGESQGNAKTINCYNITSVTGQKTFGGIIGLLTAGTVENCYNIASVAGQENVGGIIGNLSSGTVKNCYNTGTVTADKGINFGGAIGANPNAAVITNTYYLDTSVTNGVTLDGAAKTADEMKSADFVTLLNGADNTAFVYDSVNDNDGYPIFSYQKVTIEGDGTTDNPYLIYDARQLKYFGFLVNGGATTSNAKLMDHIDLSKVCGKDIRGKEVNWLPIGTTYETNEYSGTFDGNNKTINYLYINSSQSNQGLFGYIGTTGIVKDIKVSGDIKCYDFSGGITSSNKGLIENCTFSGSINAETGTIGGIAFSNLGTITKCTNNAKITSTGLGEKIGGIVGTNTKAVSECINNGEIVCENGTNVGGISGITDGAAVTKNCYNTANVTGKTNVGGVVGQFLSGAIENCYNVGTVIGTTDFGGAVGINPNSLTIINTYYLDTAVTNGVTLDGVTAKTSDEMKSVDFVTALNGTGKAFAKDEINQNKGYPILAYLAMTLEGDGTIASPYLIYSAEELEYFGKIVNSGKTDTSAKLMADIDLSTVCGPNKGGVDVPWSSIGQIYPWYGGTFDGNNKTISNLHLDGTSGLFKVFDVYNSDGSIDEIKNLTISNVTSSVPFGNTGIICKDINGRMAKISNCKVIDSDVKVDGGFASIAFQNTLGIISDCYSNIKMSTDPNAEYAGAIAGICYSMGGEGKISGCTYDGEILINSPYAKVEMVAGICGYNRNGDYIENCINYSNITFTSDDRDNKYIAGIVGQATSDQTTEYVKNCHNYGNITGAGNYIGGIGGYLNVDTENCTNEGNILGGYNCIGGIAGGFGDDRTMKNCTTTGDLSGSFWMGGVVGYFEGTMDKCSNTGNIKVTSYEADFREDCTGGGIVGVVGGTAIISNSFNTGDVISEKAPDYTGNYKDYVGGFVGLDKGGSITIINSYSSGKLKAGLSAHPVLGQSDSTPKITCTNSYFMNGVVEGTELYGATKASAEQFGSGEITVKLGDAFGQDITSATPDALPQFLKADNSNKVLTISFKPFGGEITDSSYTNFNQKIKIPAAYNTGEYGFKTQDNKWVDETSVATTNLDITAIVKPSYTVTIPTGVDFGNVTRVLENKPESEKIIKTDLFSVDATHSNLFQNEKILTVSLDGSSLKMTNGTAITPFTLYLEDDTAINSLTNVFSLTSSEIDANVTQSKKFYAKLDQSQITANGKYTGILTFTVAINDIA